MIKLGEPDHIDYKQSNSCNIHMSKVHSPSFPLVLPNSEAAGVGC